MTRRRKILGTTIADCGICGDERELRVYESWEPRGLFGLGRDKATLQHVRTCLSCGFAVRGNPVSV